MDVLDLEGRLLASSGIVDDDELDGWQEGLQPLFAGLEQALLFELDQRLFAVAVAMRNGVVIVRASAERLLELRIRSGAGRLIQEIGSNKGVVYMVLQDSLGLLAASSDVVLIDPITGDTFLESALVKDSVDSRLATFEGEQIFEAVIPFAPEGETLGLLRIGLSLDELRVQERRGRLQVLLLVLGAVGAGAVTVRQNLSLLGDAYTRVICRKRLSLSTIWSNAPGQNRRKGQGRPKVCYRLRYYSHLIGAASEWFCCGLLIMRSRSLCAALTTSWTNLALNLWFKYCDHYILLNETLLVEVLGGTLSGRRRSLVILSPFRAQTTARSTIRPVLR